VFDSKRLAGLEDFVLGIVADADVEVAVLEVLRPPL